MGEPYPNDEPDVSDVQDDEQEPDEPADADSLISDEEVGLDGEDS